MISPAEWRRTALLTLAVLAIQLVPYYYASTHVPEGQVFGGLLFNPLDGNTYLAKMEAGARGDWLFRLPYTADPGPGIAIYGLYLFLGHLSSWLQLPVLSVYQAARLLGGATMMITAYAFIARFLDSPRERLTAWLFTVLGSGFGWMAALAGGFTSDLWVAEAFPFLSAYVNPHFPLALSAMLWIYMAVIPARSVSDEVQGPSLGRPDTEAKQWPRPTLPTDRDAFLRAVSVVLATLALAILQPLALLTVGLVLLGWGAFNIWKTRGPSLLYSSWAVLLFGLVALPALAYTYWATHSLPVVADWTSQNETLSPPVWDYLISFGPGLLLLIPATRSIRRRQSWGGRFLLLWLALNALVLYIPVSFQRRLAMGIFFPLAVLAAMGLREFIASNSRRWWSATLLLLLISIPTNLLVVLAGLYAPQSQAWMIYMTQGEAEALGWLRANVAPGSLVLAAPETGLFIPARTGLRVIYGHPFETVNAEKRKTEVERFFSGAVAQKEAQAYADDHGVDYVFVGPREMAFGPLLPVEGLQGVYARDGVAIYAVVR